MRLPPSQRQRRQGSSGVLTPTSISIAANLLLAGTLIYTTLGGKDNQSLDTGVSGRAENIVQGLQSDIKNATTSLEAAYAALQEKDAEIAAAQASCQRKSEETAQQGLLLKQEAERLKQQLGLLQAVSKDGVHPKKLWLTVGIPTIPRKNNTDYLTRTLGSLFEELPLDESDALYRRVKVLVMNNRPGAHSVWQQVKDRIFGGDEASADAFARKGRIYAEFVDNPGNVPDPAPDAPEPDDNHNPQSKPGREVRRQTCDLVSLLEVAQPLSDYYVFMEDDFRVCPYTLRILSYAVRKLNSGSGYGNWLGLRFSYGMNGILVHNEDLGSLTGYLRKHTARLPPDLLWTEWYMGRRLELRSVTRGRKLAVFRQNLLDHLGARSSFSVRTARPGWPRCYHPMSDMWSLARTEKFNERKCPHSDISPCPPDDSGETWTRYPLSWPNITEGADLDHPALPLDEHVVAGAPVNGSSDATDRATSASGIS